MFNICNVFYLIPGKVEEEPLADTCMFTMFKQIKYEIKNEILLCRQLNVNSHSPKIQHTPVPENRVQSMHCPSLHCCQPNVLQEVMYREIITSKKDPECD